MTMRSVHQIRRDRALLASYRAKHSMRLTLAVLIGFAGLCLVAGLPSVYADARHYALRHVELGTATQSHR